MKAWLKLLSSVLHWALLSSVLVCVYFLLVVPVGLVLRLMGRDPMRRDFSKTATSYWEDYGRGHMRTGRRPRCRGEGAHDDRGNGTCGAKRGGSVQ